MGVTCMLSSASPNQVRLLEINPRWVEPFLTEEEGEHSPTWLQRLLGRTRVPPEILDARESMRTDLDKAWHGIQFLLTGTADEAPLPAGLLLSGGHTLAGGSHLLLPTQVAECHAYLSGRTDEELARAYDPDRMDELDIYPSVWGRDGEEGLDYLMGHLQTVRAVLRDCTEEGHGLVVTIE